MGADRISDNSVTALNADSAYSLLANFVRCQHGAAFGALPSVAAVPSKVG
jgi:hypothetical protein